MKNTAGPVLLLLVACGASPDAMPTWSPASLAEASFQGDVETRLEAGPYTYARIGGRWVVTMGSIEPGRAQVRGFGVKKNYRSKRLGRMFDTLVFGIVTRPKEETNEQPSALLTPHPPRRVWRLH